jgi:hypothetical protein
MLRIGTRMSGWISPGTWILVEAGIGPVVTVGVIFCAAMVIVRLQARRLETQFTPE